MQANETPRFRLSELVEASGIPERTIRFYIDQGIVPPALGRGRSRYFTPDHLQQLELVGRLREQKLSIEEIRERLLGQQRPASVPSEHWERITLHPDLELMLRADSPEAVRTLALRLVQVAGEWFGEEA